MSGLVTLGMAHKFILTAGSSNLGTWAKVSGLSVKWQVASHRVGDSDQYFKYAGLPQFDNLKLSRAAETSSTTAVQKWLNDVNTKGGVEEEGAITLCDSAGEEIASWTLQAMFPIAWQITEFDAGASKAAMETLEIVYSGFLTMGMKYGPGASE